MNKFFIDKNTRITLNQGIVISSEDDINHFKALRIKENDEIEISDGVSEYVAIVKRKKNEIILNPIYAINSADSSVKITLYQAVPKASKMDYIIQKCIEVGVCRVVPVITKRVIATEINENKYNRWKKISKEASMQSHRSIIVDISRPIKLDELICDIKRYDLFIMPYENEKKNHLKSILTHNKKNIGVFVGPEGGFDLDEVNAAGNAGAEIVTLGPRILRTETAGLAVIISILYEMGDIG